MSSKGRGFVFSVFIAVIVATAALAAYAQSPTPNPAPQSGNTSTDGQTAKPGDYQKAGYSLPAITANVKAPESIEVDPCKEKDPPSYCLIGH